jgi:hypothetical protein
MKIIGKGGGKPPGPAVRAERWYDRHTRSWVVQALDADGNQIGSAVYSGTKVGAIAAEKTIVDDVNGC